MNALLIVAVFIVGSFIVGFVRGFDWSLLKYVWRRQ